jgi:uncharacterized protein
MASTTKRRAKPKSAKATAKASAKATAKATGKASGKKLGKRATPAPKAASKAAKKTARKTARKAAKPAARKVAPKRAGAAKASAPAKKAARKTVARTRPVKNGHARALPERDRLSPRVTAALKAAAWAADWAAAEGRFVWHDLMTTDAPAARAFYTELFGWDVEELDMGGVQVLLLKNGGRNIATIMPEPSLPASHWMPYLAVDDVDAACQRLGELGGQVCVAATDIPEFGRFAVANDPQGGLFSPVRRVPDEGPPPEPGRPAPGDFCWEELATPDPEGAARFYGDLFGWSIEAVSMGLPYWLARHGGIEVAGIMEQPDPAHQPAWLPYLAVADVDASADRAVALGGTLLAPPADIPETGRFAVLADPSGARFALYRSSRG